MTGSLKSKEETMSKLKFSFFVILFSCCLLSLPAQVTRSYLQDMYMEFLKEQGYTPNIDDDGDIRFKYEGGTYYIIVDENDATFLHILYPYFWEIESPEELARAKDVVSYVNRTTKIAKIYLVRDDVDLSISAETLLNRPEDFKNCFIRMLRCIKTARNDFRDEMNS
jgi:hypothetical protein